MNTGVNTKPADDMGDMMTTKEVMMREYDNALKRREQVTVGLYMSECVGLVVLAETGVTYWNQTGGNACGRGEAEGFYVPLGSDQVIKADPVYNVWNEPWTDDVKARVCELLDTCYSEGCNEPLSKWLEPNPEGGPVAEAWIPVRIRADAKCPPAVADNLMGRRAILTYGNSD